MMEIAMDSLPLIDLVGEKYLSLRGELEQLWSSCSDVKITDSEWQVLARIQEDALTISEIARQAGTSRQATHKCIVSLRDKGLLDVVAMPHNRRDKYAVVTALGRKCWEDNAVLKQRLEERIISSISVEQASTLRALLQESWLESPVP